MIRNSTHLYWATTHGQWAFGVATPAELMRAHEAYTMNGSADRSAARSSSSTSRASSSSATRAAGSSTPCRRSGGR